MMTRFLFSVFSFMAVLMGFGLVGSAMASTPPASMSLTASPGTVSWPEKPDFEYRLEVTAGPEGADFEFTPEVPGWGLPNVAGSPWVVGTGATLDGPGTLENSWALVADLHPTACFRGGFQSYQQGWKLKLPPGETTLVKIPAKLTAARLADMNSELEVKVTAPDDGPSVTGPLEITGNEGVRIKVDPSLRKTKSGQRFTLTGRTIPALPEQWIQVRAEPRMWTGKGKPPKNQVILTVKTDRHGEFVSRPVELNGAATWVIKSQQWKPTSYENSPSCNGTVAVTDGWFQPTWTDLEGRSFLSTKIKGRNLGFKQRVDRKGKAKRAGKRRLRLTFHMSPDFSSDVPDYRDHPLVPMVSPNVGCNSMSGEVKVKNGIIRQAGSTFSTAMLCSPNHDGWISRLLSKGLRAKMKGKVLVLKRGKTKITLRRSW